MTLKTHLSDNEIPFDHEKTFPSYHLSSHPAAAGDSSYPDPGMPVLILFGIDADALFNSASQDSSSDSDRIDRYFRSIQGTCFAPAAQVGVG